MAQACRNIYVATVEYSALRSLYAQSMKERTVAIQSIQLATKEPGPFESARCSYIEELRFLGVIFT